MRVDVVRRHASGADVADGGADESPDLGADVLADGHADADDVSRKPTGVPTSPPSPPPTFTRKPTSVPTSLPSVTPTFTRKPTSSRYPTPVPTTHAPTLGDGGDVFVDNIACGETRYESTANAAHWLSGNDAPDHFYLITPSETAYYHFSTCGSDYDTYLYLYDVVDHEADTCLRSPAPHAGAVDLIGEWDDPGEEICTSTGSRENLEDVWTSRPLDAGATYILQVTGYSEHGGALETDCDTDGARDAGAAGNYVLTVGCGSEPDNGVDYDYVMGQAGSSTCPDGYSQIMSEEECSSSVVGNAVDRTYTNSFCNPQLGPKGCTLNTGHTDMWFMNCDAETDASWHAPVCKRDSSEFFVGDYSTSYDDAKNNCADRGASLATIYSATENELARQACGGSTCWIGLEEVGGDAATPKESQTWRWPDSS